MVAALESLVLAARRRRGLALVVVNLRLFIGFAFFPAGLKKLLDQPFTDPANRGLFHDFLHDFHATGPFYQAVGAVQLVAAVLLMTQRRAGLGAVILLPVLSAITMFCWSTARAPTVTVATLMWLGTVGLVLWDLPRWRAILGADQAPLPPRPELPPPQVDLALWQACGLIVIALYGAVCLVTGEVYRPRSPRPDTPAFYIFPVMLLVPIITYLVERRRRGDGSRFLGFVRQDGIHRPGLTESHSKPRNRDPSP